MYKSSLSIKFASLLISLLIVITAGCNNQSGEEVEQKSQNASEPIQTQTTSTLQAPQPRTFDIPSLLGKNIDEVTTILGPADAEKENASADDSRLSQKLWTSDKQGHGLSITYRSDTKKITAFAVDSPSGPTRFVEQLLALGNLNANDPRYKVKFTASLSQPDYYANAVVEPIYFRQITYTISASTPTVCISYMDKQGMAVLENVPLPWRQTVTLQDGVIAKVAIGSTIDKFIMRPRVLPPLGWKEDTREEDAKFLFHTFSLEIQENGTSVENRICKPDSKTDNYDCSYTVGDKSLY